MGTVTGSNVVMPKYQRDEILDVDKEHGKPPESSFIGLVLTKFEYQKQR